MTARLNEICVQAARAVGGGILAIDLLEDAAGDYVVNEINHTMEFRNSSEPTGVDIARRDHRLGYQTSEGGVIKAGIVGGSGYTGGELLRLLHFHPNVEVTQITSRAAARRFVHSVHPNLRDVSRLKFIHPDALQACDLLFLCLPHKTSARDIEHYAGLAEKLIDLSADFRLDCAATYQRYYGEAHPETVLAGALCVWLARDLS